MFQKTSLNDCKKEKNWLFCFGEDCGNIKKESMSTHPLHAENVGPSPESAVDHVAILLGETSFDNNDTKNHVLHKPVKQVGEDTLSSFMLKRRAAVWKKRRHAAVIEGRLTIGSICSKNEKVDHKGFIVPAGDCADEFDTENSIPSDKATQWTSF